MTRSNVPGVGASARLGPGPRSRLTACPPDRIVLLMLAALLMPVTALVGFLILDRNFGSAEPQVLVVLVATGTGIALSLWSFRRLAWPVGHGSRVLASGGERHSPPASLAAGRLGDGTGAARPSARTIAALRARIAVLEEQAMRDPLTGLLNRRAAMERLARIETSVGREGRHISLALLDVDHLKAINDGAGHAGGDALLIALGCALAAGVRGGDWVARIGGDEFLIVLDVPSGRARATAERLRRRAASFTLPLEGIAGCKVSIGLARLQPGETAAHCLGRADRALYAAKDAGRDGVVIADDRPLAVVTASLTAWDGPAA